MKRIHTAAFVSALCLLGQLSASPANSQGEVAAAAGSSEASVRFDLVGVAAAANKRSLKSAPEVGDYLGPVEFSQAAEEAIENGRAIYAPYETPPTATNSDFIPKSIFDPDERLQVENTTIFPASAIVQILFKDDKGSAKICSGSMISANTVLTAAHCLHSGTLTGMPFSDFVVIPGRSATVAPFGECRGKYFFILSGWLAAATTLDAREHDLGALRLDCDIGETTGWFGVRTLSDNDTGIKTITHGYAADRSPFGVQWISKGPLNLLHTLKGFYRNDTFGGMSGAPVLEDGIADIIIGVHNNGRHGAPPYANHNAFARITSGRIGHIANWIDAR